MPKLSIVLHGRSRFHSLAFAILLLLLGIAPALGRTPSASRGLAADGPATGMLLVITPGPGGLPPNTLHRIYPDESGLADVEFSQPLDVRRALISPDGSRFAMYVIEAGNVGRIYIGAANGASLTMVPLDATHMSLEDWHPQGDELLVWQFDGSQYDLKRLTLDGQLTALTNTPAVDERNGRWAPDGSRFSFTAAGLDGQPDVFVQSLGGVAVNISQSPVSEGAAEWSPSGERLVYEQNDSLTVSDPGGSNSAPLDVGEEILAYGWSPAGEIYASDAEGDVSTAPDDGTGLKSLLSLEPNNWVSDWGAAWTAPLALLPEQVSLAVEQGAPNPAPVTVQVNSEDFLTPWSATSAASWLKIAPNSGATPGTVELTFTTTALAAGLFAAPVTFLPGPKTLNVTVAVNSPEVQGNLVVAPVALTFQGTVGGANPAPATFGVTSNGAAVNWVAIETAPWLSLSPTGGATPANVSVSVDSGGLTVGRYETVITLQPGNRQVTVTLDLFDAAPGSEFVITPGAFSFVGYTNGPAPQGQALSIAGAGGNAVAWSAATSAAWLQLSAYSGITPATVSVLVDLTGLPPGNYAGAVTVGQQSVSVTLTVLDGTSPPPPSGNVVVTPGALNFAAIEGGAGPGVKDVLVSSANGQPAAWTASTSHPWLLLSASSGTTPETVKVRAELANLAAGAYAGTVFIGNASIPVNLLVIASAPSEPAFYDTWSRQDLAVDEGLISRTWLWGPADNGTTTEPYAESPGGTRTVEYYDKSRMEVTYPDNAGAGWFVTNGLLASELITGEMQLGDNLFAQGEPSNIPVAGDADDPNGPRYASFKGVLDAAALVQGSVVVQTIDGAGIVGSDPALASYGVTVGAADPQTGHTIASVFWSYLNSSGVIWTGTSFAEGPLFEPWFFATGLPVTEPYWAMVKVRGVVQNVLVQCFERRCMTYTPNNPAEWQVEQGNIGMHYFRWRYERPA